MALTLLPNELLDMIIIYTMPEGFESLDRTCQKFHTLCIPFMLRRRFNRLVLSPDYIATGFDLIKRIANEPRVARYIRRAYCRTDSCTQESLYRNSMQDVHGNDAVRKLFADSPYLKQAGLDWELYYAEIEKDLRAARYSQHAAAFLLTLLPNVEGIYLPRSWKSNDATNKLIDVIVRKARQSYLPYDEQSLAQVSIFELSTSLGPRDHYDLNLASPFLALPRMRNFWASSCVAMNDSGHTGTPFKIPYVGFTMTLQTANFECCCIDPASIAKFLKHSPSLKTLRYSHSTKENIDDQDWNICDFVTIIEREAGGRLEELSVFINKSRGSIVPGRVSMSGFQRLRTLELPLEIAIYIHDETNHNEPFIDKLIPVSVSKLSLISEGTNDLARILDVMFRDFAVRKEKRAMLFTLEEIILTCPRNASDAYKAQCTRLFAETAKAGVALQLTRNPSTALHWNMEA